MTEKAATPCASAVLRFFGCENFRWTWNGKENVWPRVLRRNGWSVRSRKSKLPKGCTVGRMRQRVASLKDPPGTFYVVRVPHHVFIVDEEGRTVLDTAPRKRDRRRITGIVAVF